ncbi:pseudaminic acid synthase [Pontibacter sp. BT310]|jgi:pseudaminic acid synthase|uniref:Pseudaminic acid synthase n=1 Tax=Pontibacter populi TaxID=890055 RepID=A0ABS6XEW6_9BACT|nr:MULTISPECIES: pseudaminic acid synthase [Pontibacter]MBJ6119680.1 pseudaminic acid synthase [Pontibacter sp. BT310]MBR0572109.1 pseudaminic acid synthase [Microvirga sp. STS03]MBW3366533.1 pseudaminic acid synthase [Pontibacter populi]
MINDITIASRLVGPNHKPFIIAEMSGNHNQSLERALAIVDAAAQAGADAIKLQTYTADTMTLPGAFTIEDENSLWKGRELYDLYKEAYTPWEWHQPIFDRAREHGMLAFSSPFDETAVDFLEELEAPVYKIASFENTDHPLLRKVAATGKPVIMSTGAATVQEVAEAVQVLREAGCQELILLKCTSTYPSTPENTNLLTIPHMRELYGVQVGLSDHTMGVGAAVAAVALGATVIEKHFTLRRADGGVDSAFSLEPEELNMLVVESERAWLAMGHVQYGVQKAEEKSRLFKRSVYAAQDIKAGDVLTKENIRVIRPGLGLAPKYYDDLLGKTATTDIKAGTPFTWGMV